MKFNVNAFIANAKKSLSKHCPEILVATGIVGMGVTVVLAVKATPKAIDILEREKEEKQVDKLTQMETVKATWKCYVPAATTFTVSAACIAGANSLSAKRFAALAAAYELSELRFGEYRDKVVEFVGDKKEKDIRHEVNEERIKNNPVSSNTVIVSEKGNTLCFDSLTGRYFRSDIDAIKRAANKLNREMISSMYISASEWFTEIGLEPTSISDELGWRLDDGLIEIDFSSHLAEDGTPCVVIDYLIPPKYDFNKFY